MQMKNPTCEKKKDKGQSPKNLNPEPPSSPPTPGCCVPAALHSLILMTKL